MIPQLLHSQDLDIIMLEMNTQIIVLDGSSKLIQKNLSTQGLTGPQGTGWLFPSTPLNVLRNTSKKKKKQ